MNDHPHDNFLSPQRRQFISNSLKLVFFSTIVTMIPEACKSKTKSATTTITTDTTAKNRKTVVKIKKKRQQWSRENLVINSKTGVMHLPSSRIYHYYDEIKLNHIRDVGMAAWATSMTDDNSINRQQSGIILEILSLQQLKSEGITEPSLSKAADILSRAFTEKMNTKNGKNLNETNFRLHELMLQYIALNNSIPIEIKWQEFRSRIIMPTVLRKRQTWMSSENNFNDRVKYIQDRNNEYLARLGKRMDRYLFT